MFRINYVLGGERAYRDKAMRILLAALTQVNREYFLANPNAPSVFAFQWKEEPCGTDDWLDASALVEQGYGDCEEICAYAAGWIQAKRGIMAWPQLVEKDGHTHVVVELPNGKQFDPTLKMGRCEDCGHECTSHGKNDPEEMITFVTDLFRSGDAFAGKAAYGENLAHRSLAIMLHALFLIDCEWLRRHPETPLLYQSGIRYELEPVGREDWQDWPSSLRRKTADCIPLSALVLKDDYTFAPFGTLKPGDRIMGDGTWTQVQDFVMTGEKPLLAFGLDNGCVLRCTPEHRVFLENGEEIRAKDVKVGDRLKAPTKEFPTSVNAWSHEKLRDDDFAWLVGVYIADGWVQERRFAISGFDENPKRGKIEQKERVEKMMAEAGIETRWAAKYISVTDRCLHDVMATCGSHAPNKRVPNLNVTLDQAKAMIEGLQADSSLANSGTITHGTTSPELALQLRVLYRMLGQSVHIKRWDEHGGLGSNPIYRIGVRRLADETMPKNWQTRAERSQNSAGVRSICEEAPELCGDITTDSGAFYLPECDLVVHNCEDLANLRASELQVKGRIAARPTFIWRERGNKANLYHIQVTYPNGAVEDPSRKLGMGSGALA